VSAQQRAGRAIRTLREVVEGDEVTRLIDALEAALRNTPPPLCELPLVAVRICSSCGDRLPQPWERRGSVITRKCRPCANKRPPCAPDDIDDVVVYRLIGGERVKSNVSERRRAAVVMSDLYQLDSGVIAARMRVARRTVVRYIRENRASAA